MTNLQLRFKDIIDCYMTRDNNLIKCKQKQMNRFVDYNLT